MITFNTTASICVHDMYGITYNICKIVHTLNKEYLPIVLSGGCFQNLQLLQGIYKKLIKENYTVYWHEKVSCNDEGIALGQLAILSQRRK